MSVLVIAESNGKEVDRGTLSAITAAQKISNEISLLILEESEEVITTVGSLVVLPSVSSPSSDTSVTSLLLPGVLAVT